MKTYNQDIGAYGEKIAQEYLIKKGYKIIATNVKVSFKEIDIIALHNKILVFVEVKTRTSTQFGTADEAVTNMKTNNLKRAVGMLVNTEDFYKKYKEDDFRVDLIAVDINKGLNTIKIKQYEDIV